MQKSIRFLKKPRLSNPILITAWPGMGEVALKSTKYLIEKLGFEAFAYMVSSDYFYPMASEIKNGVIDIKGLPQNYFYYYKSPSLKNNPKTSNNDLIIFLSNTQPDLAKAGDYADNILEIARLYKVGMVISFAALPASIDHIQNPAVWFSATNTELFKQIQKHGLKVMKEGEISGMNGLFLGLAKKAGFPGFCLLGEVPIYTIQIENPKTSFAILEKLKMILNLPLDLNELQKQGHFIEEEINKLVDYLKEGISLPSDSGPAPISDKEIEKIKKALTQLTRLPRSVKEKIERLFELSRKDISKANELKQELDTWTVYKEYEDRFLDLFKKPKNESN
ncbi:MAG: PAC2 family protein [Candidatus Omnitrophota bacterium]